MVSREAYQFHISQSSEWLAHLNEHGYVVVLDALSQADVANARSLFERDISMEVDENGFLVDPTVAHSDFAWFTRTREGVRSVYSHIYDTSNLITAFDRASLVPNEPGDEEAGDYWLHVDYPLFDDDYRADRPVFQSFVSFYDPPQDAPLGFRVVPRVHLPISTIREDVEPTLTAEDDCSVCFWTISAELVERVQEHVVNVKSPAGSLTLWASDVAHDANTYAAQKSPNHTNILRLVLYTCYTPIEWAFPAELEERQNAFRAGYTTTHWPCMQLVYHFDERIDWDSDRVCSLYPEVGLLVPLYIKRNKR